MQDSARLFLYTQVMIQFSQNLINEARAYFSDLCGREISQEETESFLKSLLNLYNSFYSNK